MVRDARFEKRKCQTTRLQITQRVKYQVFYPYGVETEDLSGKMCQSGGSFYAHLLFVYDSRKVLDPLVERIATLQYRFVKGGNHHL